MTVRRAGLDDLPALEGLYRAFFAELPPREHDSVSLDRELSEIGEIVSEEHAFLAEGADGPVGFALARRRSHPGGHPARG